jgi:hypothetical protein
MALKKKGVQPEAEIIKEATNKEKLNKFKKTVAQIKETEKDKKNKS